MKDFFRQVREAEKEIRTIRNRQAHMEDVAYSMTGMSTSTIRNKSKRSRVEYAALELARLSDDLGAEAEQYVRLTKEADAILAKMDNARYRRVLTLRYLCDMSWRSVADEMGYTEVHSVLRLHGWALKAAGKIFERIHTDT